jgi:hypothetical protein
MQPLLLLQIQFVSSSNPSSFYPFKGTEDQCLAYSAAETGKIGNLNRETF